MAETITLDPSAVATSRTQFDLTPFISSDGIDWGTASIEQHLAEAQVGQLPIDFRLPNRQVSIALKIQPRGTFTFEEARRQIQAKAALFQRQGGWISRVTAAGTFFADVMNASLKFGGDWAQAQRSVDINAQLDLELRPDFYGAEVTLDDMAETTAAGIFRVLKLSTADATIRGDYPARVRMVVDDDQAQSQLGLLWGFRSQFYDSATTAALNYQAEALTPLDAAGTATVSSTLVVRHNSLATTWTPVLSTQISSGSAHMTHKGTYQVWARVTSTSVVPPRLRLVWDVGDLAFPEVNDAWTIPTASDFYLANLGAVQLYPAPTGTHRWQGVIQAEGSTGGENVSIDQLFFQPVAESAGALSAVGGAEPGSISFSARDEFNQTAGALTGKTAAAGGVWVGAGDTDDFSVETTGKTAQRTAVSDANVDTGRYAVSGVSAMTTQVVQVDVKSTSFPAVSWDAASGVLLGPISRYVDVNNWLMVTLTGSTLEVRKRIAGATSSLGSVNITSAVTGTWYTLRLMVEAAGRWTVWMWATGGEVPALPVLSGFDSSLAAGGTLASGKPGFYDAYLNAAAATRNYDNFVAWAPDLAAVIFASQSAELRWDGMFREDSTGSSYGPVSSVTGDLPLLPPSGLEGRKVELFLKGSRGDLDQLPDPAVDDISAQTFYRPSWLITPGS